MTLKDFINKWNNKTADYDGVYGGQCVDLMNFYMQDVVGVQRPNYNYGGSTAYEIYKKAKTDDNFTKIENTPTGVPIKGSIMFWDTTVGSAGHVAIYLSGDVNRFKSFDQNWPTGSVCKETEHSYLGVCGWLEPKRPLPDVLYVEPVVTEQPKKSMSSQPKQEAKPAEVTKPIFDGTIIDGNKTKIITGLSMVVAILASQGYIDQKMVETINLITTALIGYTLRDAIKKK